MFRRRGGGLGHPLGLFSKKLPRRQGLSKIRVRRGFLI